MKKRENKLFISYDEAAYICDKSQYNESTIWERILLAIRMIHCRYIRKYSKRNGKLTDAIKKADYIEPTKSSSVNKNALKERLNKELLKG